MALDRSLLLADDTLTGHAWCEAHSVLVDGWLRDLFAAAAGEQTGVALLAVGGYGRSELCPHSDIDVVLVHQGVADIAAIADRLWYPIWDEGLKLGHSVRTVKEAMTLAGDDLDTATSLLSARHVAGDEELSRAVAAGALTQWRKRAKRWLPELGRKVEDRHGRAGEVAFLLEPDLKEGRGGLRDVHALGWIGAARQILFEGDDVNIGAAYEVLLAARVELHRHTGRTTNVLALQDQDAVASALGDTNADALMARVAAAARTVAWTSDEAWRAIGSSFTGPLGRIARRDRELAPGVVLRDGEVHVVVEGHGNDPHPDPVLPLRAAAIAATNGTCIDRQSLEVLAANGNGALPDPWPAEARQRLAELLLAGPAAVRVIEALDQRGLWVRLLPEWAPVQSRPQRNAYHRYTVDRHLVETAVGAAALADRVERPDLLVIGALLHDIGKGYPGDHTQVGMTLVRNLCTRMGFSPADVDTLVTLVEHHLLLPDVATRRDLDDPGTIDRVVAAVGDLGRLQLLAALTEADSLATGPSAWGAWKAGLVAQLVQRAAHVLGGGVATEVVADDFPPPALRDRMASGERVVEADGDTLTVIDPDRPGLFSRVAGVLSLHGLGVRGALAYSSDDGVALARFTVNPPEGRPVPWDRVTADLQLALRGRLALNARLAERARTYDRRRRPARLLGARNATVAFDNVTSSTATVVDVEAPDAVGLLYRITNALAELELDIRQARVQTLGPQVVDAFYVRDASGHKITDQSYLAEIERAVIAATSPQ